MTSLLDSLALPYEVDGRLVRGLDYYTKTAFEISSTMLGSQDALAGGGRYDLLVEELGGKPTPGIGFAAGIERLMMVLEKSGTHFFTVPPPDLFFVALDDHARTWSFGKAYELRRSGISAEIDYLARSIKAQMREANRQSARYVLVVGESELASRTGKLKNMKTGEETAVYSRRAEYSTITEDMAKKKGREPEYSLNIFHHYDEKIKRNVIVFLVQTIRIFVSFRYEILLEEAVQGSVIDLKIVGLHVPELLMPQTGPAAGRRDFKELQGSYTLNISKQDKTLNIFQIEILPDSVEIRQKPGNAFLIVSNEPVSLA